MNAVDQPGSSGNPRGLREPKKAYNVRLPMADVARIRNQAELGGVTETEVVAQLALEGLARRENAPLPGEEFQALSFTLAAMLDRLESIDRLAAIAARSAIGASMASRRSLRVASEEDYKKVAAALERTLQDLGLADTSSDS